MKHSHRPVLVACALMLWGSTAAAQDDFVPRVTSDDLRITISAVKPRVLVGEFTKLKADWLMLRQAGILFGYETIDVDDGTGFRLHAEATIPEDTVVRGIDVLPAGASHVTEYVLGLELVRDLAPRNSPEDLSQFYSFVFPKAGLYRFRLNYREVVSNVITVEAVIASGSDAAVLAAVKANIGVLTPYASDFDIVGRAQELLSTYAGHVYLAPVMRSLNGGDSLEGVEVSQFESRAAFDFSQSAFAADEAFWQAALGRGVLGDAWGAAALQQVVDRYPGRSAAGAAAAELRSMDSTPTVLSVGADPGGLWPPNGRLVPIRIVLSVSDATDQTPDVVLEAITCNDSCTPDADVQGATVGTRDVDLSLRATRTGGGSGRTYTVTYKATDAAGNVARASTTVLVPHDRR